MTPNPAVNSDAPAYAFVLHVRPRRRAGYLSELTEWKGLPLLASASECQD